jgi:hypothetical protein
MREELLHYIWQYGLFDKTGLSATTGEQVHIIKPGLLNKDAGPDFGQASIQVGNTTWVGNIELHVNAADWNAHRHQHNEAYNNVILHVVYHCDAEQVHRQNGTPILQVQLKDRIDSRLLARYQSLMQSQYAIPCGALVSKVDESIRNMATERMAIERLEQKVQAVQLLLQQHSNDWEQVLFIMLARYLGSTVNREVFEVMAAGLPHRIIARHADNAVQLEALLLGQAGMLQEDFTEEYPQRLKQEYKYLKRLHNLTPLQPGVVKFARVRPQAFPTVRLAKLAAALHMDTKLFGRIIEKPEMSTVKQIFEAVPADYWQSHFRFGEPAGKKLNHRFSDATLYSLVLNAVCPLLFSYGRYKNEEKYCDKALDLLQQVPAEKNNITALFQDFGFKLQSAYDSQAVIQLKRGYCESFGCARCPVGNAILKQKV